MRKRLALNTSQRQTSKGTLQRIRQATFSSSSTADSRFNRRKLIPEARRAFWRRHCLIEMTELREKVADLLPFDYRQTRPAPSGVSLD